MTHCAACFFFYGMKQTLFCLHNYFSGVIMIMNDNEMKRCVTFLKEIVSVLFLFRNLHPR